MASLETAVCSVMHTFNLSKGLIMKRITRAFQLQAGANGLKMILGAALVVLSGQIDVLNDLIVVVPDYSEQLNTAISWVKFVIQILEWLLTLAGNGLLSIGVIHKIWKFFNNK